MTRGKNPNECPRCGSKYLEFKGRSNNGEMTVICNECNYKFRAYGTPLKKHEKK